MLAKPRSATQEKHTMTDLRDRISLYLSWLDEERRRHTVLIGLLATAFVLRLTLAGPARRDRAAGAIETGVAKLVEKGACLQ